ncbi:biotin--[acetyl-CoA-carboxylase] ligase [Thermaurantiacus tibetensis]|uniref:biotin--[acetyl-CoA-carboxylase] ligase n=1 Tax=Thermaurantiacus tibetensis TaxID=2759035 RepID=UPI0018906D15|nr:biotin--[acetyl-CoA-carboxylase] ligase [Thermaurantiacus tibetensis]
MIVLDETPSTSDWLLARVAELPDGTWVRARRQTAGRGRQGRPWQMAEGNLAASGLVRLRPGDPPAEQLGFVAGVALHRVASAHAPEAGILLKWPNDLLLRGAKLAGILLDRAGDHVVVGIGVNLAQAPDVSGRATAAFPPPPPDPDRFLAELAEAFADSLGLWRVEGFAPIAAAWRARSLPPGTPIRLGDGRRATLEDLADDGALRVRTAEGVESLRAGDIFLGAPEPSAA